MSHFWLASHDIIFFKFNKILVYIFIFKNEIYFGGRHTYYTRLNHKVKAISAQLLLFSLIKTNVSPMTVPLRSYAPGIIRQASSSLLKRIFSVQLLMKSHLHHLFISAAITHEHYSTPQIIMHYGLFRFIADVHYCRLFC